MIVSSKLLLHACYAAASLNLSLGLMISAPASQVHLQHGGLSQNTLVRPFTSPQHDLSMSIASEQYDSKTREVKRKGKWLTKITVQPNRYPSELVEETPNVITKTAKAKVRRYSYPELPSLETIDTNEVTERRQLIRRLQSYAEDFKDLRHELGANYIEYHIQKLEELDPFHQIQKNIELAKKWEDTPRIDHFVDYENEFLKIFPELKPDLYPIDRILLMAENGLDLCTTNLAHTRNEFFRDRVKDIVQTGSSRRDTSWQFQQPTWSPCGKLVAFGMLRVAGQKIEECRVFVIDDQSQEVIMSVKVVTPAFYFQWSSDSQYLTFLCNAAEGVQLNRLLVTRDQTEGPVGGFIDAGVHLFYSMGKSPPNGLDSRKYHDLVHNGLYKDGEEMEDLHMRCFHDLALEKATLTRSLTTGGPFPTLIVHNGDAQQVRVYSPEKQPRPFSEEAAKEMKEYIYTFVKPWIEERFSREARLGIKPMDETRTQVAKLMQRGYPESMIGSFLRRKIRDRKRKLHIARTAMPMDPLDELRMVRKMRKHGRNRQQSVSWGWGKPDGMPRRDRTSALAGNRKFLRRSRLAGLPAEYKQFAEDLTERKLLEARAAARAGQSSSSSSASSSSEGGATGASGSSLAGSDGTGAISGGAGAGAAAGGKEDDADAYAKRVTDEYKKIRERALKRLEESGELNADEGATGGAGGAGAAGSSGSAARGRKFLPGVINPRSDGDFGETTWLTASESVGSRFLAPKIFTTKTRALLPSLKSTGNGDGEGVGKEVEFVVTNLYEEGMIFVDDGYLVAKQIPKDYSKVPPRPLDMKDGKTIKLLKVNGHSTFVLSPDETKLAVIVQDVSQETYSFTILDFGPDGLKFEDTSYRPKTIASQVGSTAAAAAGAGAAGAADSGGAEVSMAAGGSVAGEDVETAAQEAEEGDGTEEFVTETARQMKHYSQSVREKISASTGNAVLTEDARDKVKQIIVPYDKVIIEFYWSPDSKKILMLSSLAPLSEIAAVKGSFKLGFNSACRWVVYDMEDDFCTEYDQFLTRSFYSKMYTPFFDQYCLSITPWSPDSTKFVFIRNEGACIQKVRRSQKDVVLLKALVGEENYYDADDDKLRVSGPQIVFSDWEKYSGMPLESQQEIFVRRGLKEMEAKMKAERFLRVGQLADQMKQMRGGRDETVYIRSPGLDQEEKEEYAYLREERRRLMKEVRDDADIEFNRDQARAEVLKKFKPYSSLDEAGNFRTIDGETKWVRRARHAARMAGRKWGENGTPKPQSLAKGVEFATWSFK